MAGLFNRKWCVVVTCLAIFSDVYAESLQTKIQLAAEDSWPPYSDSSGQGVSTDLVRAAYEAVGRRVDIAVVPYSRVERNVYAGAVDGGYNVTRQASTEDLFLFGDEVLLTAPASFYVMADSAAVYGSYDDIPDGARIGLIIGYEYGDIYQNNAHRFEETRVSKQSQLIKMIMSGRIDAAIMFDEVAQFTLRELNFPSDTISKSFQNHVSDIYVGFSLKRDTSSHHAKLLDQGLRMLRETGEYQAIMDGYFGE